MVVVRESPHSKISPSKSTAAWPPKSPFQALLSSPSGRKKWQERKDEYEERSPSPSPLRRPMSSHKALHALALPSDCDEEDGAEDEEDDDEETLALKLEEIKYKLKMKRLQAQKAKGGSAAGPDQDRSSRTISRADSSSASPGKSRKPFPSQPSLRRAAVEIPLSPVRDRRIVKEPVSPARVRLGLDGLKAQDVSLKRARDGTQLKRSTPVAVPQEAVPQVGFSERLMLAKEREQDQRAKDERIRLSRSQGFGLSDVGGSFADATRPTAAKERTVNGSRVAGSINAAASRPTQELRQPSGTAPSSQTPIRESQTASAQGGGTNRRSTRAESHQPQDESSDVLMANADNEESTSYFDAYSTTHLTKRHISHTELARAIDGKEIYTLPRLLKEVKAPDYEPPDCDNDFVVFATLASKSTPYNQKPQHRTTDEDKPQEDAEMPRNKFMVLKLCDLKWELDCFLFGTAFDQFWKLTPGTLLAILNPNIMPPKTNQLSGKFCLKLGSSEDCIMEIGTARDLGYCVSVKKNGEQCGAWVDKRKTEVCEFHINMLVEKTRASRMEVNTMWRGHGGGGEGPKSKYSRTGMFGAVKRKEGLGAADGSKYGREYGQIYSVPAGHARSAANLLDADNPDGVHGLTKAEASRKRIAANQKERDTARRLAQLGNGAGAEYLRVKHGTPNQSSQDLAIADSRALFEKPSAAELGLLANKASDARLSPAKDGRKRAFGAAAMSTRGPDAMGWSGAAKWGLLQPKSAMLSPERGQGTLNSSPKKKARLLLEGKGVRVPGRESLGEELKRRPLSDDDDDLDIV